MIFDCFRASLCACTSKSLGQYYGTWRHRDSLWSPFIRDSIRLSRLRLFSRSYLTITRFNLPSCAVRFGSTKSGLLHSLRVFFVASTKLCFHQSRPDALSIASTPEVIRHLSLAYETIKAPPWNRSKMSTAKLRNGLQSLPHTILTTASAIDSILIFRRTVDKTGRS